MVSIKGDGSISATASLNAKSKRLIAFPRAPQGQSGDTVGEVRKGVRRFVCGEPDQLLKLLLTCGSAFKNAAEYREPGWMAGALEFQLKCRTPQYGRVEHVCAVGNHNHGDWPAIRCKLVDLFNQDIDAGTIFMMRLHLASAGGKVIGFIDNENGAANRVGPRFCLVERLGYARRKFANMTAATDIGWGF